MKIAGDGREPSTRSGMVRGAHPTLNTLNFETFSEQHSSMIGARGGGGGFFVDHRPLAPLLQNHLYWFPRTIMTELSEKVYDPQRMVKPVA